MTRDCPTERIRRVVSATGQTSVMEGGFEETRSRAAHYAQIVSNVGPIEKVAAVGESASLIGTQIG